MMNKILRRNKKVDERSRDIVKGAWARMANGIPIDSIQQHSQALPSHQSLYKKSFEATSRSTRSEESADTGDPRNSQLPSPSSYRMVTHSAYSLLVTVNQRMPILKDSHQCFAP